jgi:hypothetical protein
MVSGREKKRQPEALKVQVIAIFVAISAASEWPDLVTAAIRI